MSTLLLIDGNPLLYKGYFQDVAKPDFVPTFHSCGFPLDGVIGFCTRLWDLMKFGMRDRVITHGAIVFDVKGKNWRHDLYPLYKAQRQSAPDDLLYQLQVARAVAPLLLGLVTVEQAGFEADDLIATYARHMQEDGGDVIIATGDKDFQQLLRHGLQIFDPGSRDWSVDMAKLRVSSGEKIDVEPWLVADIMAIGGDTTDGIPGIPGIGIKGAIDLIVGDDKREGAGSLEALLDDPARYSKGKKLEKIVEFADQARLCRRLVAMDDDVPVKVPLHALEREALDPAPLMSALRALEITGFSKRVEWEHKIQMADFGPDPMFRELVEDLQACRD